MRFIRAAEEAGYLKECAYWYDRAMKAEAERDEAVRLVRDSWDAFGMGTDPDKHEKDAYLDCAWCGKEWPCIASRYRDFLAALDQENETRHGPDYWARLENIEAAADRKNET